MQPTDYCNRLVYVCLFGYKHAQTIWFETYGLCVNFTCEQIRINNFIYIDKPSHVNII